MKDKRYIILGYNKENDKYYGYVECSFCMDSDENRVKVYGNFKTKYTDETVRSIMHRCEENYKKGRSNENPNSYNQHLWFDLRKTAERLNKNKFNDCVWKVYRVGSKHCPVTIDFNEVSLMRKLKMQYDKYKFRNQPFKIKCQ